MTNKKPRMFTLSSGAVVDLDQEMTLRDGTTVTFGEMTLEQHEECIAMAYEDIAETEAEMARLRRAIGK
jgi:hypothetical protein